MSVTITNVQGEIINDSRGIPTLLVTVTGSDGSEGSFSVPSGASTGIHEAHELRDGDGSHGNVTTALHLLTTEIRDALVGKDILAQREIDELLIALDGTPNKKRLGGNTLIGVSIALAKAAAVSRGLPVWQHLHASYFSGRVPQFPRLYANIINGGKHAATALAFQEYHIVPKSLNISESLALVTTIQDELYKISKERFGDVSVGDEGGYALPLVDVKEPLAMFEEVTRALGVRDEVEFALDVASSSFFDEEKNAYKIGEAFYDTQAMNELYKELVDRHQLLSIEDPFSEEDFTAFTNLPSYIGGTLRIGDDLTTTNKDRLLRAINERSVDGLIIKPNQIGTLTETIDTMLLAYEHNLKCIVSHRSGETLDDFIADLAYASAAFGIKAGARGPKEREAKYSRLLAINASLS